MFLLSEPLGITVYVSKDCASKSSPAPPPPSFLLRWIRNHSWESEINVLPSGHLIRRQTRGKCPYEPKWQLLPKLQCCFTDTKNFISNCKRPRISNSKYKTKQAKQQHKGWRHLSTCFQYTSEYYSNPNSTVLDKIICVDQWKKYRAHRQTYMLLVVVQSTHNGPGRWKDWKVNAGWKMASLWRGMNLDPCLTPININSRGERIKQRSDIKKSREKIIGKLFLILVWVVFWLTLLQVSNRETNERVSSGNVFALQRRQYT